MEPSTDLTQKRAALSAEKLALLERRRRGEAAAVAAAPQAIPRRQEPGPPPLSFAQQRLWFLDRLAAGSSVYAESSAQRILWALDVAVLARAIQEIVRRHEVLRTRFPQVNGEPVQVIAAETAVPVPVLDLRHRPPAEREAEALRRIAEEVQRPFNLEAGPLLRTVVLRLDEQDFVLLLTMHHIVSDGWSMRVLSGELEVLYNAFAAGHPSPLPELPIQYGDFAVWQRRHLQGEVLERQLAYWRRQLTDLPTLQLPTDRPRPAVFSYRGEVREVSLPAVLNPALSVLAKAEGGTLFMVLLASFAALLHRVSGQSDVVVGAPVANRNRAELEGLIGFFVNILVLRADFSGAPTGRELLKRVRQVALDAYACQDLPFEKLVEALHPQRGLDRNPLFQVICQLHNAAPADPAVTAGAAPPVLEVRSGVAKFDLRLDFVEGPHGLHGRFEYSTDLFDPATVERLAEQLANLLSGLVAEPQRRVGELPLLSPAARHQLLREWSDSRAAYPDDQCVHELVAGWAERTPGAVALDFEDGRLTYGELDHRAEALARRLRGLGVREETPVAVCASRSAALIVGLLGVLKAGGAYVPLDPSYPRQRLEAMLADCAAPVLLADERLFARLPDSKARVVSLDGEAPPPGETGRHGHAAGTAYVMYTSGSTGEPKGIAVTHRGIVRLVVNAGYLRLGPGDTVAQASSVSFDAATFEIWGALLNGARLVGVPRATLLSAPALAEFIREKRVDTCLLTTALFHQIALQAPTTFHGLRHLLVGGEALDPQVARAVLGESSDMDLRLLNAYGPTESTTMATAERVERPGPEAVGVPIGRPIGNTACHVVDRRGEPVPIGVAGELWIGGDGLARGYFGRPDLTAEWFTPDPFGPPGGRLYRTGDLVRHRSDGRLEFLGRRDQQVKLRGFRIEPGEVEAAIAAHPGVRQVVVLVREDVPGDRRLVAYVVPQPGAVLSPKELRDTVRRRLAEFMVPAAFVELASLPLNANGKVDREALPRPDLLAGDGETALVPPRNHLEGLIATVWQEVLGMAEVGVHHNFFDLGGQSLLMIKVQDRLQEALDRSLPITDLFEHTTISALARYLEQQGQPQEKAASPAVSERAARQRQALTRPAQRPRTAI